MRRTHAGAGRAFARGWLWTLALWLVCALAQAQTLAPIPALDSPVIDTTGTLDAASRQSLEAQAIALQQRKGSQLQVLVVPTTQPEDIAQYAVRAFEQWKIGRKGVDDGVLLVVAKEDRRVRIEVGYGLEGAIPDATASRVIQEYLVPHFRSGDYAGGIGAASTALTKLIDGEPLPAPMADNRGDSGGGGGESFLIALFVAFVVAQVARGIFNGAPRPLRALLGAGAAGGVAWLLSSLLLVGGIGAAIGFVIGLISTPRGGRFARDAGWGGWGGSGGGGWGGGGGFGGGGGGWSGGGGSSGGGGASGSW
ncbi:TPM domain-containing protein [Lysobacter sp. 5GHs7-4]|uniref:TPM domain-containing protein n=1 Tax=Lysobacter sp. 5GHs7-4 TaxID=2904253 RepID=UPI001E31B9E6|nr:TPM domain-containing protein [Lysobacter sp. 5GHs7-4]UHQ24259.1 TPM domain-containing protein [Lysobacter sp. 5GHs7-4]